MFIRLAVARAARPAALALVLLGGLMFLARPVHAQNNGQNSRAVGGVSISPEGVLNTAAVDATGQLRAARAQSLEQIPGELNQKTALRKVSLRGLEEAILAQINSGKPLSDAMRYLAGLEQIEYVFVYPEKQDIVLAGFGEGWKVDPRGNLVGVTTGRPVLLLDDLLVALRTARQAARGGISCSIDPTEDGLLRLRGFASKLRPGGNLQAAVTGIEQNLGPQMISVTGVPATTHFARVMVAADYRMKRLAMNFDPPPIRGLPSYLGMVSPNGRGMNNMLPRWWLTAEYEPLVRDGEGLSWQLPAARVKAMAEEDYLAADGKRQHTGKANPMAQRWAETMTAKYDELALADPIFAQLRSCMELAVVGALIAKENLAEKAGYSLPVLLDPTRVEIDQFPAPRQVDTKASLIEKGNSYIISASGGVQMDARAAVVKSRTDRSAAEARTKAVPSSKSWWWN